MLAPAARLVSGARQPGRRQRTAGDYSRGPRERQELVPARSRDACAEGYSTGAVPGTEPSAARICGLFSKMCFTLFILP